MIEREFQITRNAKSQGRKSHSKSQNRQAELLHKKTHTFTIIAMNFVQEQFEKTRKTNKSEDASLNKQPPCSYKEQIQTINETINV